MWMGRAVCGNPGWHMVMSWNAMLIFCSFVCGPKEDKLRCWPQEK